MSKGKIIEGKLYNINSARNICDVFSKETFDKEPLIGKLYRTKTGNYFLYLKDNQIIPISDSEANDYISKSASEISGDNIKIRKNLLLEPRTLKLLEELKGSEGIKTDNKLVDKAVEFYSIYKKQIDAGANFVSQDKIFNLMRDASEALQNINSNAALLDKIENEYNNLLKSYEPSPSDRCAELSKRLNDLQSFVLQYMEIQLSQTGIYSALCFELLRLLQDD